MLPAFLKLLAMLVLVRRENEQDQNHTFQETYFESSVIHQLTIMHCFEHINHDNPLNFLFQNLYRLFLHTRNLHH